MADLPLFDPAADELAASRIPPAAKERRIFDLISPHRGHASAIPIRTLHTITGLSERSIKDAVAELIVTHKVLIGASRNADPGYFMIDTAHDQEIAVGAYKGQILAMLKRLRVLESPHKLREWLGQQVGEL